MALANNHPPYPEGYLLEGKVKPITEEPIRYFLHAPEITDEVILQAFEGTNFGRTDYRAFLAYSVLKKVCGWLCGWTITTIMIRLNLITEKRLQVTKLGKMFLSDCYQDPLRIKQ